MFVCLLGCRPAGWLAGSACLSTDCLALELPAGGGLSWVGVLSSVWVLGRVAHMFWVNGKILELEVWF